jgi:hypothetical protein
LGLEKLWEKSSEFLQVPDLILASLHGWFRLPFLYEMSSGPAKLLSLLTI